MHTIKNIAIGLALLASVINLRAQATAYVRTNLDMASTITNASTYTYTGTNAMDCRLYGEVGFEHSASGPGVETNNYVYTFKISNDGTNYAVSPTLVFLANGERTLTNFQIGTYRFVKLHTRVSTNAVDHTNAYLHGTLKGYRRD